MRRCLIAAFVMLTPLANGQPGGCQNQVCDLLVTPPGCKACTSACYRCVNQNFATCSVAPNLRCAKTCESGTCLSLFAKSGGAKLVRCELDPAQLDRMRTEPVPKPGEDHLQHICIPVLRMRPCYW
jgi:hypothetical protein